MGELIDGQILRTLRERRGLDQSALARVAEVDQSVISRIENGRQHDMKLSVVVALARALDVGVAALIVSPPPGSTETPSLIGELGAVVDLLATLPKANQRQVAALLRGYLAAMPE